jgi:CheY-like chemotaxis protein
MAARSVTDSHRDGKLILIVDGQEEDQIALSHGLRRIGVRNTLHWLRNGREAIEYLTSASSTSDNLKYPLPAALFLDPKLPVLSGWEVLDWLHGQKTKPDFLIFICTRFTHLAGVQPVYGLGAHRIIKKPVQQIDLLDLIYHFPAPWRIKSRATLE